MNEEIKKLKKREYAKKYYNAHIEEIRAINYALEQAMESR